MQNCLEFDSKFTVVELEYDSKFTVVEPLYKWHHIQKAKICSSLQKFVYC